MSKIPIPSEVDTDWLIIFNSVKFIRSVSPRAHTEILSVDRKDANRFLVKTGVTVEIEGEETPALYAEWLGMQFIG